MTSDMEVPEINLMTPSPPRRRLHPRTINTATNSDPRRDAILQNAMSTINNVQQRDEWDSFGDYIATNARGWEPDIAVQFKLKMMALVLDFATADLDRKQQMQSAMIIEEIYVDE